MIRTLLTAALVLFTVSARAEIRYTAEVYDSDSNKQKLLYNYKSESESKGETIVVSNHFTYPDGKIASHEEITFEKDGHVSLYKQQQAQIGAEGTIEIAGGKAKFVYKKDGKEKTATEDAGSDFIVGSQIPLDLEANWEKILKGETLKRRLAVLERLETVGFQFSKEGETDLGGKKAIKVKMKPSSFLIAAIVSPLHFFMSADGKELLEIHGRTTVKKDKGGGKFGDLDAVIVYHKAP